MEQNQWLEQELDRLLEQYREACPAPEVSPFFLSQLWARIDAREANSSAWRRLTRGFVTFAAAVSILLALLIFLPAQKSFPDYTSYVETLADTQLAGVSTDTSSSPVYVPPREDRGL